MRKHVGVICYGSKKVMLAIAILVWSLLLCAGMKSESVFAAYRGETVTVDSGIRYCIKTLPSGNTPGSVELEYYPNVKADTVTAPEECVIYGEAYRVDAVAAYAFKDCTTPKTIVIKHYIPLAAISEYAFINGTAQTAKITLENGEWITLYRALERKNPTKLIDDENIFYYTVPKGTYTLPEEGYEIHVYSNTSLYLKGVTFLRNTSEKGMKCHMLTLGVMGSYGYEGGHDIAIYYGTFNNGTVAGANNICRASHLENVTIKGTTFKYMPKTKLQSNSERSDINSHCIEMAGCRNVTISGCKFYNNKNCFENNEAVQIESCTTDPEAKTHTNVASQLDGTQSGNITITGCTFKGFNYGCGSNHLGSEDSFINMKFTKNTFIGCHKYCICIYNYDNVTIKNNTMEDCGSLYLDANKTKNPSTNLKISKNKTAQGK